MMFNHRYFILSSCILLISYLSSSTATFCSNLTSTNETSTPCFQESIKFNPARLRTSSGNLVLPCHVARVKRSIVEWWYQDFANAINIKIYPVHPAVRPTVLRLATSTTSNSMNTNETNTVDFSVLLRNVNVDDSGVYRCIVRPWTAAPVTDIDDDYLQANPTVSVLTYHVELTSPRICRSSYESIPCFQDTRTSSPAIIHGYQSAFLQCVVQNKNLNVFWVVGNSTMNRALIVEYLTTNQHNGDRLRRVFPVSAYDYSIELTMNRDTYERSYSCVIDGTNGYEPTIFTYIVRSIDIEEAVDMTNDSAKNGTKSIKEKSKKKLEKIMSHDSLTPEQIDELRQKNVHDHDKTKSEKVDDNDKSDEAFEEEEEEKTATKKR